MIVKHTVGRADKQEGRGAGGGLRLALYGPQS